MYTHLNSKVLRADKLKCGSSATLDMGFPLKYNEFRLTKLCSADGTNNVIWLLLRFTEVRLVRNDRSGKMVKSLSAIPNVSKLMSSLIPPDAPIIKSPSPSAILCM